MSKRQWFVFGLILIVVSLLIIIFLLKTREKSLSNSLVPGLTTVENNALAMQWTTELLIKYPHQTNSYSGVNKTKNPTEVWIIGRKVKDVDPNKVAVENISGRYSANYVDKPTYTVQTGDVIDENIPVDKIMPYEIKDGDYFAIRATYLNNAILALEVRKLIRE